MKFLHMADLHIGKVLCDVPLLEDQRVLLKQAAALASEHKADAVVIAGDIYQKAAPQAEAMSLFNEFLSDLHSRHIPVLAIGGNHDSDRRVAYLSDLVVSQGIHLCKPFAGVPESVVLRDEYGEVEFHLLPFLRASLVRKLYPEEQIASVQEAVAAVLRHTPLSENRRHVLLAHQYISGALPCDSEDRTVGGLDAIDAGLFDSFDYVALGHIHTPQSFLKGKVRYCGSLMKYSFSEVGQHKGPLLVELREKGNLTVTPLSLTYPHEMRELSGSLEALMNEPPSGDFLRVTVTDEEVAPDARILLRQIFPNMMVFGIRNSRLREDRVVDREADVAKRSVEELFTEFYTQQNNGTEPTQEHLELLREILREMGATEA